MTHRHAFRRGVAPRPSDKDLRAWGRLLKRAEAIGDCSSSRVLPFTIAAEKADKAIAPVGHQRVDSPFVQLVRAGLGFLARSQDQRRADAPMIARLAAECRAVLAAPAPARAPTAGGRRERKDIDG